MNTIPAEIASSIISHVDQGDFYSLTLVNRHFYTVGNPMLWRDVEIRSERQYNQLLQGSVLSKGDLFQHLRRLTIHMRITDALFLILLQLLPPVLETLVLSSARHITDASLKYLLMHCPQLTSINLHQAAITDRTVVALGQHCHQLLSLRLEECDQVSPNVLTALAACPLEDIFLNATLIGGTENDQAAQQFARALATFSHLQVLALREIDQVLSRHLLDRKTVLWPHLTACYFQGCDDMEDQDVIRFIKTHPHLERLALSGNDFSDTVLYAIADALPHLTYLDLSASWNFTHHGVRRIVLKCPLLTDFVLDATQLKRSDFPELGPYSDKHLAQFPDDLEWATQLGDLSKHHMDIIRRAANDNNDDTNASDE